MLSPSQKLKPAQVAKVHLLGVFLGVLVFVTILFLSGPEAGAELSLTSKLEPKEVALGQDATLTVSMEWPEVEESTVMIKKISPPSCALLELKSAGEATASRATSGGIVSSRIISYLFKTISTGTDSFSAVTVEYVLASNPDSVQLARTEPIEIKVVPQSKLFSKYAFIFLGVVLIVGSLAGITLFLVKRFKFGPPSEKIEIGSERFDLEKKALIKLKELRAHQVSGDLAKFFLELENLLIQYIKDKHSVSIRGMSPSEMRVRAKEMNVPDTLLDLCAGLGALTEKVRFGSYQPNKDEQEKSYRGFELYLKSLIPKAWELESIETVD